MTLDAEDIAAIADAVFAKMNGQQSLRTQEAPKGSFVDRMETALRNSELREQRKQQKARKS